MPEAPRMMMISTAPWPSVLEELIQRTSYKEWTFKLRNIDNGPDCSALVVDIITKGTNSYDPTDHDYRVHHYMQVPPATYDEHNWQRWLFEQCLLIEGHECGEFFKIDGKRPYAPHHQPGSNPYTHFERGTDKEARTMYTGAVRPSAKLRKTIAEVMLAPDLRALTTLLPVEVDALVARLAKAIAPEIE